MAHKKYVSHFVYPENKIFRKLNLTLIYENFFIYHNKTGNSYRKTV